MELDYRALTFLIADDFSNFRSSIASMLTRQGARLVLQAGTAEEIIHICSQRAPDVIICDYNLGNGRTGQQVLEELRLRRLIARRQLFVMVSAETSKEVVMATYDAEPSDYLMKPITVRVLTQRLARLVKQQAVLLPALEAVDRNDLGAAVAALRPHLAAGSRYGLAARKVLGDVLLAADRAREAEQLYVGVLEGGPTLWAQLGLARSKFKLGDLRAAQGALDHLIETAPLYLPAYDCLAEISEYAGEPDRAQLAVAGSVRVSPRSILRQKRLASIAESTGDLLGSLGAWRAVVRLGERSCYAEANDALNFARLAADSIERELAHCQPLTQEVCRVLHAARQRYCLSSADCARADLAEGRALALAGNRAAALSLVATHLDPARLVPDEPPLTAARVATLKALGEQRRAEQLLQQAVVAFAGDEAAMLALDPYLDEPLAEASRERIAASNRRGIGFYNAGDYRAALDHFERALNCFPHHPGLRLNALQALWGLARERPDGAEYQDLQNGLAALDAILRVDHPERARLVKLRAVVKNMAAAPAHSL